MACPQCQNIIDRQDIPHVIRECENCGRIMYVNEPGKHGKGLNIKEGDKLVIPLNWLSFSPNPLKGSGKYTITGLQWFAEWIFLEGLPSKKEKIVDELNRIEAGCDSLLKNSEFLKEKGLDITNPNHAEEIIGLLKEKRYAAEWWIFQINLFLSFVREGMENNDIEQAIWGMACAERCRSMLVFKREFEEVVFMGHSAKRVVDVLKTWDNNKANNDESFWQMMFTENSYVISQVFAVPMVFIKDKAFVGGMNIDRKEAKFVDYLFSTESSREAILVEIKTPVTKLMGIKYRGTFRPSSELTGAIVQVLDYRTELTKNLKTITEGTNYNISHFNPRCVLIIGNGELELKDEIKRKSFELFRTNFKDVDIITYDELFRKVDILANLFNLVRKSEKN